MDEETIEEVDDLLNRVADREDIELEKVIVFGSRARDDYRERSDIDLLIVSPDFEGVAWNKRPGPFYEEWDYGEMPTPEFLCLTPEEFNERKNREGNIVRTAVKEGVGLA